MSKLDELFAGKNISKDYNWCSYCWFNARIEIYPSTVLPEKMRYSCHSCGLSGWLDDPDGPKFMTDEDFDKWHKDYVKSRE